MTEVEQPGSTEEREASASPEADRARLILLGSDLVDRGGNLKAKLRLVTCSSLLATHNLTVGCSKVRRI